MRKLPLFLALLLMGCKAVKPAPVDSLRSHQTLLALEQLQRETLTPQKTGLFSRLFGGGGKVKVKGTVNINTQTATGGSTIGASSQTGTSATKTKGSATSTAETQNTGGQGSEVSGSATATATNTPKKGLAWYWLVGIGAALGYFGPGVARRLINPV